MKLVKFWVSRHFGHALWIFLIMVTLWLKCRGEGGGIFPTLCVECCLVLTLCGTPDMHWSAFVIMIIADYLSPIMRHAITSQVPYSLTVNALWNAPAMTTPSNENIFPVTGSLCGEFTGDRWIPLTKACDAELWCFLWSELEQTVW